MKSLLLRLRGVALCGAALLFSLPAIGQANLAGDYYASNFNTWTVPAGNNGAYSWSSPSFCNVTSGGVTFPAFQTGQKIRIVDIDPSLSETVVVQAFITGNTGCSIVVTPNHQHYSYSIVSASYGLQEAIRYAKGKRAVVHLTPEWYIAGATISLVHQVVGITAVTLWDEDISSATPTPYAWNGSDYVAQPLGASITLQTNSVDNADQSLLNLVAGDGINLVNTGGQVTISQGPTFAITSFTGAGTIEIGATLTNPVLSATYSITPNSAQITNTDGIDSPHVLTTPFTSATITGSFVKHTAACTTFTLTAVGATTQNRTQQECWAPRTFYGVGTGGGATGATASGDSAVLVGATGTLGTWGLGTNTDIVSVSPSNQYLYFILSTSGHSFKVNGFTTTFTCTSISFTNQNGDVVPMYQCVSPTFLTGTYSVEVS